MLKGIQRGFVINGESEDDFSALKDIHAAVAC
jgi:hypothetical protein